MESIQLNLTLSSYLTRHLSNLLKYSPHFKFNLFLHLLTDELGSLVEAFKLGVENYDVTVLDIFELLGQISPSLGKCEHSLKVLRVEDHLFIRNEYIGL